ncbi:MAG: DUF167 domain-containing protein [Verrucomicrobia bacterium]|nr:DUF167 domain-containing protein [Verrucomicrobiota bacterium]
MGSIQIKVVPKASRSEIAGWEGEKLKVRIAAVPEKGRANAELIRLLSLALEVAPTRIKVVAGLNSRLKRIEVEGLSGEEILARVKA